ncbi:type II toxin-antitoxin system VapB family antitoxin [Mesorhizobium sp.]|uniref:type II toxin-antitoxin system VapB family antitoxin n=1 Tax=Mesorhizobium sp. TaxID=1871066 RepID=UPI00122512F7|nr:type II toxin-antitoxin system VapB family antitoxin [Mesorhizobium sp.]TIP10676.1 MAG: histidinol dehydrogenase [Mesorhizobium sp.]
MPLYVRDDDVDALAVELQNLTKARSKTEAVRLALQHEIERSRASIPLRDRIAKLQERAAAIGLPNPNFDMKKFTDEMWGDD